MEPPKDAEVIEFPTSTIWFDEDGVLYSVSKKTPPVSVEESKKTLEEFVRLTGGKKVCMIIDMTNASPTDKESREFGAEVLPPLTKAIGMVSRSPMGRMIANLFFGLKPPPYPVKMFANEKDAKEWIKQYL
jgi:hypothetical protein